MNIALKHVEAAETWAQRNRVKEPMYNPIYQLENFPIEVYGDVIGNIFLKLQQANDISNPSPVLE